MISDEIVTMTEQTDICKTPGGKLSEKMAANLISIVVALLTASGVGYGFYYTTTNQLQHHDKEIHEIQMNVKEIYTKLNDNSTIHTLNSNEIKHLNENCKRIEENQKTIIKLLKK